MFQRGHFRLPLSRSSLDEPEPAAEEQAETEASKYLKSLLSDPRVLQDAAASLFWLRRSGRTTMS